VTEALFIEGIDEPEESAKRCSSKAPMGPNVEGNRRAALTLASEKACAGASG
jgi:hypothetical protein